MTELIVYNGELYHAEHFSDEFLAHYGVPGMRWGKRKATITRDHIANNVNRKKALIKTGDVGSRNKIERDFINKKFDIKKRDKSDRSQKRIEKNRNKALENAHNHEFGAKQRAAVYALAGKEGVKNVNRSFNRGDGARKTAKEMTKPIVKNVGKQAALKYGAVGLATVAAASPGIKAGLKNYKSGQYINEAGRRVWANPNFQKTSYNAAKQVGRAARSITR